MTARATLPDLDALNPNELKALIFSQHEQLLSGARSATNERGHCWNRCSNGWKKRWASCPENRTPRWRFVTHGDAGKHCCATWTTAALRSTTTPRNEPCAWSRWAERITYSRDRTEAANVPPPSTARSAPQN